MPYHYVYRPLRRYLLAVSPEQQTVQLSLDDLEDLLGPRSASGIPVWTPQGVVEATAAWTGFRAHFDHNRVVVSFTRTGA